MGLIRRTASAIVSPFTSVKPASGGTYVARSKRREGTADTDEYKWSKFGQLRGLLRKRDIDSSVQDSALQITHEMNSQNPIAHRLIDIPAEYAVGSGIKYKAEDPRVQAVLDAHWTDITNNWDIGQFERAREFGLTGELCFSISVNPIDGHVKLGYIDPELIESVVRDPLGSTQPHAVILKKMQDETQRRVYKVVSLSTANESNPAYGRMVGLPMDDVQMEEWGMSYKRGDLVEPIEHNISSINKEAVWEGSCFFFKMNSPLTATRGWSDLLPGLDWLDAHDQFLFSQVEKAIDSAKFIWGVLIKGGTKESIEEFMNDLPDFSPGQRIGHNEGVEYDVHSPDLHLEDAGILAGVLKNHILAGAGYPPIWFAESMTSRASAPEMTEPAFKHLIIRQRYIAYFIKYIFRYVIDTAFLAGTLRSDGRKATGTERKISAAFYISMPDVSAKDQRMLSIAVRNFASSIKELQEGDLVTKDEAKRMVKYFLDLTGVNSGRAEPLSSDLGNSEDRNISIDTMFHKIQKEGGTWNDGQDVHYLSPDVQLAHGTKAMSRVMESLIKDIYDEETMEVNEIKNSITQE
jgi:hypothetical protein